MSVSVEVDTSPLWDNARAYVWKFIGQDEWTFKDGMNVSVSRIHVKY